MHFDTCECCRKNLARTGVRLLQGWAQVCGGCAEYISLHRERANAPGVILQSRAAQAAFDIALRDGMTITEAVAVAEPIDGGIRQARIDHAVKRGWVRDVSGLAAVPA